MDGMLMELLARLATQEGNAMLPLLGFCHSYDIDAGEANLRRIRVTYAGNDGRLVVSPLLFRVVMHPGSDPPVPSPGALVLGFWLNAEKTEGVYLGVISNESSNTVTNFDQTKDWFELLPDGVVTIRAKTIRLIAEEGIELRANVESPNHAKITIGGLDAAAGYSGYSSDIVFQDGFGCDLNWRSVYNAVNLDEDPELDA